MCMYNVYVQVCFHMCTVSPKGDYRCVHACVYMNVCLFTWHTYVYVHTCCYENLLKCQNKAIVGIYPASTFLAFFLPSQVGYFTSPNISFSFGKWASG